MNSLAWFKDPKRSGNSGSYFNVLNNDFEYGLSFDTRGRECERVTSRSASNAATVLLVIDVPPVCVHDLRDTVHGEDLFHQFLCQYTGFVGVNVNTDDVSGEDIEPPRV